MINFLSIGLILSSILALLYILVSFKTKKRVHILAELFFLAIFSFVLVVSLFPQILRFIEEIFGLTSAIQTIIYFSIFTSYILIFTLYRRIELQRQEITKLVRELALQEKKK